MQNNYKSIKNLIGLFFLLGAVGCFQHYYKAVQPDIHTQSARVSTIDNLNAENRYFILRCGSQAYYMKNISVNDDKTSLNCTLDSLPSYHQLYLNNGIDGKMKYKPHDDLSVLNEVHIFVAPDTSIVNGNYVLQLDKITRISIIEKDKSRTTTNHIFSGLGIGIGIVALTAIIAAAAYTPPAPPPTDANTITCSPQVYTVNSYDSELNGTLCSGAIYASLERSDYLPVSGIEAGSGQLNLLLKGEKNEELMMKNFKLIQATHSSKQKILIDKNGKVLAYENPVTPEHAFIGAGTDVVNDIVAADKKYYSFNNDTKDGSSNVILDFKKPLEASTGKLIIKGKNSQWAFYVFNEFKKLYGSSYHQLIQKKDKESPAKVLQCEIDQSLPLLVSVKDGKNWKLVDYFYTPGNAAERDMIMQLNLNDFKNNDHVQIKLQTAYMFWDIDYAAMDFSDDRPVSVSYILPSQFYKSGNVSQQIQFSKNNMPYQHINGGEQLHMTFSVNTNSNETENTYFLEGNGYYHDNTTFKQKPQLTELKKCSGKGGFDRFSRRKFDETMAVFNQQQDDPKKDYEILK